MKVKIKLAEGVEIPKYATDGSVGFDIAANEDRTISSGATELISTGLFMEIPKGYELQIRPRSGTSFKTKFRIANSPGTIDSDYRGEIKVIIDNIGLTANDILKGDRIAQGVLKQVEIADFELVDELSDTARGAGGFGHTGK